MACNDTTRFSIERREFLKTGGALGAVALGGGLGLLPAAANAAGGEFERFKVAIWSGMPNLDPEQNAIRTSLICEKWLFDPLVWRDPSTNALEPYLAEEFSYREKNTWRFKIREGVRFHNGKPLNARSVEFAMKRRLDEKLGSPHRKTFLDIAEIKVVDDYTIDFICKNPFPTLPAYMPVFYITEPGYYTEHPKEFLALNPMGSGPFRLEEYKPDDILRVARNDEYWGQMPVMKRVEAPVILEDATRVAALLAGDLHISPRPTMDDFERIAANPATRVASVAGNRIVLAGLNYDMEPFGNKKVRQAVNHAVNAAEINEIYLRGTGELMGSALPSTVPGHHPDIEPYPHDPDLARSLLAEAGYPNGFKTRIEVNPGWLISGTEVTQAIAHYLRAVGIEAELQVYDAGTLAARITSRKAGPMYMLSWGGNSTFDGDSYIQPLFGTGAFSCNHMPEIDDLVQQGRSTADQGERVAIYRRANEIIHEEAPWIFLYLQPNTYGASTDHDWQARPDEMIPLYYVKRTA